MDFSAIKDLYIGSTPVQSAWLNGSKVWGRNPSVDEQPIRGSMIPTTASSKTTSTRETTKTTSAKVDKSYWNF